MNRGNGYVPFNLGFFIYKPGRRLLGLHIKFSVGAVDAVGVLHQVTSIFKKYNIPIINLGISSAEPSHAFIFLDVSDVDQTVFEKLFGKLISELKHTPYIADVRLVQPIAESFIFDPYFFPLMVNNERAIIFLRRSYEGFIKLVRNKIGSGVKALLFFIGYDVGIQAFRKSHAVIAKKDLNKLLEVGKAFFQMMGYGIIEEAEVDMENARAIVRIKNCFECEMFKGSNQAESHFVRGIIAGWCSQLFGREVAAIEKKCIAKGDPYCEFHVSEL